MQAESDPSIFQPQWTLDTEQKHRATLHKSVHIYRYLPFKNQKACFSRLCRPAVPLEKFLQPTCPPMKIASRHKLQPSACDKSARFFFFLDSNMPKMPDLAYYAFISPSAWPIPLKKYLHRVRRKICNKKA
jgi:hypothetical protein